MIFSCLSPVDLANFSLTCRTAYNSVKAFSRIAYDIRKLLSRYFPEDQIDAFRYLQDRTRTLISGSTALQFFDRTYYEGSDLDLYVEGRHAKEVLYFIRDKGYVFDPRDGQPKDLDDAIDYAADDPYRYQDDPEYAELVNAISAVFNFSQNGKKIQVITSRQTEYSPLSIILSFHSSVLPFLFGSVLDAHSSVSLRHAGNQRTPCNLIVSPCYVRPTTIVDHRHGEGHCSSSSEVRKTRMVNDGEIRLSKSWP